MSDTSRATGYVVHLGGLLLFAAALYAYEVEMDAFFEGPWGLPFLIINLAIVLANETVQRIQVSRDEVEQTEREGRDQDLETSRIVVVEQLRNLEIEREKLLVFVVAQFAGG